MNKKVTEIEYDQWFEEFKPVVNHLIKDAPFNGCMFETYQKEDAWIREKAQTHPNQVWTLVESDEEKCIVLVLSGFHYVNRLGHFYTEKPFEGEVVASEYVSESDLIYP